MPRARNIKPGFFSNDELAECSPMARLLFIGLWTIADREGRLEDRPKKIKGLVFPFDSCDVEPLLDELAAKAFIKRYEVNGAKLLYIPSFKRHQKPHRNEAPSVLPPMDEALATKVRSASDQGTKHSALNDERGMRNDECGKMKDESPVRTGDTQQEEIREPAMHPAFLMWWTTFPAHKRTKQPVTYHYWKEACGKLVSSTQASHAHIKTLADAEDWLLKRLRQFCRSPASKGKFAAWSEAWLRDARYDDADEAWNQDNGDQPKKQRIPGPEDAGRYNPVSGLGTE